MSPSAVNTKQPHVLSDSERHWAATLAVCGVALILGTLVWYGLSHTGTRTGGVEGALVTKITTTSEPSNKAEPKTTTTTEYGETIVIFDLTIGTAMLLCGAFYGRIREIKVEGMDLSLEPAEAEAVNKGIEDAVNEAATPKKEAVAPLAKTVAHQRAAEAILTSARGLPTEKLEEIGRQAVRDVLAVSH